MGFSHKLRLVVAETSNDLLCIHSSFPNTILFVLLFIQSSTNTTAGGENAHISSFLGVIAVADLVKTILVSKAIDKILKTKQNDPRNQFMSVANVGVTILRQVPV